MKRFVSFMLSVVMIWTMLPAPVWADEVSNEDRSTDANASAPIEIASGADFAAMESDGNYVLICDITVEESVDFSGTFDGGNHTIYGVPFGTLTNASVKNLKIEAETSHTQVDCDAGLLAAIAENSVLLNVHTSGSISLYNSARNYSSNAGGLVADARGTTIIACSSSADVTVSNSGDFGSAGGLLYYAGEGCVIIACYSTGKIQSLHNTTSGSTQCKAGYICAMSYNPTVEGCYGTGDMKTEWDSIGAFSGADYNNADAVWEVEYHGTQGPYNGIPLAEMKTAAFAAQLQSDLDAALEEFAPEYAGQFIWYQPEADALPECTMKGWMVEGPSYYDLSYGTFQDPASLIIRNCTGDVGSVVSVSSTSELFSISGGNYDQMAHSEFARWTVIPPDTYAQGYYETVLNLEFSDGTTKQLPLRYSIGPCTPEIILEQQYFTYNGESPTPTVQVLLPEDTGHVYDGEITFTYFSDYKGTSVIDPPVEVGTYYMQASIPGVEGNENYTSASSEIVGLIITEHDPSYCGAEGDGSNMTWELRDDGTLVISGEGAMADFGTSPWDYKDELIKAVSIAEGVTTIGKHAFNGCQNLTSVELPESLVSIGEKAFRNCTALTSIDLPDGLTAIEAYAFTLSGLTEISMPASVSSLGEGAFQECRSLRTVVLPEGITEIAPYTFFYCYLDSLTFPSSIKTIAKGSITFSSDGMDLYYLGTEQGWESVTIDQTDNWLRDTYWVKVHFSGLTDDRSGTCGDNLTWYLTKEGVLTIAGTGAMYDYEWQAAPWYGFGDVITKIIVEDGATSIGSYAFSDCIADSVTLPEGIVSIGEGAFLRVENMYALELPKSLETIGSSAFAGCDRLWNISLPDGLKSIGYSAFSGCNIGTLIIPDSVTSIGTSAFTSCVNLKAIVFPKTFPSIVTGVCAWCINLKEVAIPDGCETIENIAFDECRKLNTIYIPERVTSINTAAFRGCSELTDVYYSGTQAQWEAITIGSENTCLTGATIHFEHTHTFVTEPEVAPTCTYPGTTEHTYCGDCNFVAEPSFIILPAGHAEVLDPAVAPTCTEDGLTQGSHCSVCGEILVEQQMIAAAHDWQDTEDMLAQTCNLCGEVRVSAVSGYCGGEGDGTNLAWSLEENGTLAITGEGVMKDFTLYAPWYDYRKYIKTLVLDTQITSIGQRAFINCQNVTGTLPDLSNMVSIGAFAFAHCKGLTGEIQLSETLAILNDGVFYNCSGLTGNIPDLSNVTSIGSDAFHGCSGLTGEIKLSETLTILNNCVFAGCSGLTGDIPDLSNVTSIGYQAFSGCSGLTGGIKLSEALTELKRDVFAGCSGLNGQMPDLSNVASIGNYAFYNCSGLTGNLKLSNATSIGDRAFYNCSGLTGTMPDLSNVTSINSYAFYNCHGLTGGIKLSETLTTIKPGVFCGCSGLNGTISGLSNVTSIGSFAFSNCTGLTGSLDLSNVTSIEGAAFHNCSGLTGGLDLRNAITIGYQAFRKCIGLTGNITGMNNVTSIGFEAFDECSGLTGEIPDLSNVVNIGFGAFADCRGLTGRVKLSDKLTSLNNSVFNGCKNLDGVLVIPESVTTIGNYVFDVDDLHVVLFEGDVPTANNKSFSSHAKIIFKEHAAGWTTPTWTDNVSYAWDGVVYDTPVTLNLCEGSISVFEHEGNSFLVQNTVICTSGECAITQREETTSNNISVLGGDCKLTIENVNIQAISPIHLMHGTLALTLKERNTLESTTSTWGGIRENENTMLSIDGSGCLISVDCDGSNPLMMHSLVFTDVKQPTCTEGGCVAHWYCTACDSYYADEEALKALDPESVFLEAAGHQDADGNKYCDTCGYDLTPPFEARMENGVLILNNAPEKLLVLVAGYENGHMVDCEMLEAAAELPIQVTGNEVKVFFVHEDTYKPLYESMPV